MYVPMFKRVRATTAVVKKKTISITYSECVSVSLCIQDAMHIHDIVGCGLPGYTIFFHII